MKPFLAFLGLAALFFVVLGGSICTQVILWKTAWYIAVMHLVLVVLAVPSVVELAKRLFKYL